MPRITSWLKKPLMVLVAVVLVILGAGTARAETTPPPSATAVTAAIIEVPLPEAPPTNDPCNPVGVTTNIDWAGDLPASDEYVLWTENAAGTARTASLRDTANTTWSDSTVSPKTFRLVDSGVACEVPLIKVTAVNGTFADECGPDFNLSFTPAVTAGVKYVEVRDGNTIKVTPDVTDPAKYELTNPEWSQTATDQLVACDIVQTKAFVCKYVGMGANERLQTGNNPIMIDRKDDMVIGSFFGDAQKRSVVIGFGNPGDPDMPISACPAPPETPDPVVTVTTESRDNCELGYVQTRTVTTTRSYAWQGTDGWVLGDPVVSYGEWVNTDTPATGCEIVYLELAPLTVTATCGAVTFANPASNPSVAVYYGDFTQEAPDGSVVVMPGKSVTVKTERTSLDGIVFAEGYYDLVFEDVVVEQKCATPVDPEPPVKPKPPVVAKPQPPAQPSEWVDTDDLVKPIIDAGVDTPATVMPMEAGSVFGTTAASIAMATLLMLSVALAWRQRSKLAAVFTRR